MVKNSYVNGKKVAATKKGTFENTKRSLWNITGSISLGLGIVGIAIPLLPTTPFLLSASYCYCRGSRRLDRWLLNNKYLGEYIKNYREGKGIPLKVKVLSISFLWITIIFSIVFIINILIVQIILIMIAIGVTTHILALRTLKK